MIIGADTSYSRDFRCDLVLNFGNDSIKTISLIKGYDRSSLVPVVKQENGKGFIEIHYPEEYHFFDKEIVKPRKKSVLTYKFNRLIEFNESPTDNNIEKIEYSTDLCFGTCPKFELNIEKNRKAKFVANIFNFSEEGDFSKKEGEFETIINKKEYSQLIEILNYIDFKNLDEQYYVTWTDAHSCELKITYGNGKIKTIRDYGLIGTYGLIEVYKHQFELRFNQDWKEITKE